MILEEEDLYRLTQIGFTKTQAKVYWSLLRLGKTDGRMLSKSANAPRTVIYRTLDELQKMGLVEKEIAVPYRFRATPLKQAIQILMAQKLQQYEEQREKAEALLLRSESYVPEVLREDEWKFSIVENKDKILQVIKSEHDSVQQRIDILSTLQRWLQILDCCFDSYLSALDRGVKYRVVIEKLEGKISFPANVHVLLAKPNFKLRISRGPLRTNAAIIDQKAATFNFFPSKSLAQSPLIWTNHPSFIIMCQDHFDKIWKSSLAYEL